MAPLPRDREKLSRMEQAVRVLIHGLGEDLEREGLRDTPKRVAKALLDCTQGYHQDTSSTLGTALFHEPIVHQGDEGVVLVRDIDFASTSEETLLPFHGRCHVAYRPKDGVVLGLSKLARLTKQYAKRLQTQERLAAEIAVALQQSLECHGVAVVLQARQLSNSAAPEERTNACVSGVFAAKGSPQLEELLSLLDLEDLPSASIRSLDGTTPGSALAHMPAGACGVSSSTVPGVPAPGTPDPSEKDTDGDSDDLLLESSCCCDEMEAAVQQLLLELGENPHRPGLAGSARRYVMSLLASTSGYHQQQQQQPCQQQVQAPLPCALGHAACGAEKDVADGAGAAASGCAAAQGRSMCDGGNGRAYQSADGLRECSAPNPVPCQAGTGTAACGSAPELGTGPATPRCYSDDDGLRPRGSGGCAHGACCARVAAGSSCRSAGGAGPLEACSGDSSGLAHELPPTGPLHGAVTLRLPFSSQCEHHMLPFYGTLMVSYFPPCGSSSGGALAAAAPLPRSAVEQVVGMYTQRLQVQERITHQVADAVESLLRGRAAMEAQEPCCAGSSPVAAAGAAEGEAPAGGVMVVCDAAHMCMVARGVENHSGSTTTFAVRGAFATRPELRRAVLRLFREHC